MITSTEVLRINKTNTNRNFRIWDIWTCNCNVFLTTCNAVKCSLNCHNEPWMIYGSHGQKQWDLTWSRLLSADGKQHTETLEQSKPLRWANLINFPRVTYISGLLGMLCRCWAKFDCVFRGIVFVFLYVLGVCGVGGLLTSSMDVLLLKTGLVLLCNLKAQYANVKRSPRHRNSCCEWQTPTNIKDKFLIMFMVKIVNHILYITYTDAW